MVDAGEEKTVLRQISFTHPNNTDENLLVEHLNITEIDYHHFDFSNLTQVTTIRAFERIDGINYRLLASRVFPDDYEAGVETVIVVLNGSGNDMKITLQSSIAEGSAKVIPGNVRDDIRL